MSGAAEDFVDEGFTVGRGAGAIEGAGASADTASEIDGVAVADAEVELAAIAELEGDEGTADVVRSCVEGQAR